MNASFEGGLPKNSVKLSISSLDPPGCKMLYIEELASEGTIDNTKLTSFCIACRLQVKVGPSRRQLQTYLPRRIGSTDSRNTLHCSKSLVGYDVILIDAYS